MPLLTRLLLRDVRRGFVRWKSLQGTFDKTSDSGSQTMNPEPPEAQNLLHIIIIIIIIITIIVTITITITLTLTIIIIIIVINIIIV